MQSVSSSDVTAFGPVKFPRLSTLAERTGAKTLTSLHIQIYTRKIPTCGRNYRTQIHGSSTVILKRRQGQTCPVNTGGQHHGQYKINCLLRSEAVWRDIKLATCRRKLLIKSSGQKCFQNVFPIQNINVRFEVREAPNKDNILQVAKACRKVEMFGRNLLPLYSVSTNLLIEYGRFKVITETV